MTIPAQPSSPGLKSAPLLDVRDLTITLPDGTEVLRGADVKLCAGQVVSLLGPSGAGKTTIVRALLDPGELRSRGYGITMSARELRAEAAFVPQRGALLDHLDVAGNIRLAQAANQRKADVDGWLSAVELDVAFGVPGRAVSSLSGGQAQRVAVARTLAAGRRIVVLDEPSVGLDPASVRTLARLLRKQAQEHQAAILVITHDLALAGGASDELWFLDVQDHALTTVHTHLGPVEELSADDRRKHLGALEAHVEGLLERKNLTKVAPRSLFVRFKAWISRFGRGGPSALGVFGSALLHAASPRLFFPSLVVLGRTLVSALLGPALFYAIVGFLLGITVPYVVVHLSVAVAPKVLLDMVGGSYILSLAPPLSAIVFASTSGSAITAWIGGQRLHGQILALEGLGVSPARYLFAPAWLGLLLSYLTTFVVFTGSMIAGGYLLFREYAVPHAIDKLTADFLDPSPGRAPYRVRALWLVLAYGLAVASIAVARGSAPKERSEQVTSAMTSSVMRATLLVVTLELLSIALLFSTKGAA